MEKESKVGINCFENGLVYLIKDDCTYDFLERETTKVIAGYFRSIRESPIKNEVIPCIQNILRDLKKGIDPTGSLYSWTEDKAKEFKGDLLVNLYIVQWLIKEIINYSVPNTFKICGLIHFSDLSEYFKALSKDPRLLLEKPSKFFKRFDFIEESAYEKYEDSVNDLAKQIFVARNIITTIDSNIGGTYYSLLNELESIPKKELIESPVLDYTIEKIDEILEEDKYGHKDIRGLIPFIFIKGVDPVIKVVLDSYLTGQEQLRITTTIFNLTKYAERLEDDEQRVKERLRLVGDLLKSWRSLGSPKYTHQVLEVLQNDEDYPGLTDRDVTVFQGMFDKFTRPLDIKENTKRWYEEALECLKKDPGLSDKVLSEYLGTAIGETDKKKLIKKLRKEYEKESK